MQGEVFMKICSMAILGALVLAPLSAQAQGTITGVSPNPSPAAACGLDTITVSGTGTCGTFLFYLGDATPTVHLPGNFPILVYHSYSKAGTYSLKAEGQGSCKGTVTASLNVVGPTITSMYLFSQIRPGGEVIIQGEKFGNLQGKVLIHLKNYAGQQLDLPLQNLQWGDTFAAGTIPYVVEVLDQPVMFTVVSQCGATSNAWTANFTAARTFALMPFDRITCSTYPGASVSDQCQGWGGENWPSECGWGPNGGLAHGPTGFQAYHASGWGFSGNSGNDQYSGSLNNGWVLASVTGLSGYKVGNGSTASEWYVSPAGTPSPQVGVPWHVDNCGMILYYGDIDITGPAAVPY
jgi:hypothetical protein